MSRRTIIRLTVLLSLATLVLVNMLAQRYKFRVDLTQEKRYTLGPATLELLQGLPETATVTAWFTGDLPPELAVVRDDLKDLLEEYATRSGGKLVFEFKDPSGSEALTKEAIDEGIRPLLAQTREQDRSVNLQVLMGATVRMAGRKAVIPAFQQGPGMEWTLSSALAQVMTVEKPLIGVLQGHGEPSVHALDELAVQLNAQYDVEATAIYDAYPINERFSALLIIDPQDSFPPEHLRRIDEYMAKGHGVVLAFSAVDADLGNFPQAKLRDVGLGPWLERHGVRIGSEAVADRQCGQIGVVQSAMQNPVAVPFPFYPLIDHFSTHPVTHGLDRVMFQFTAPVIALSDSATWRFTPILQTNGPSARIPLPFPIDLQRSWTDADFGLGPQVVGAALETRDSTATRLVVFGNGNFCTGEQGGRPLQLPKGNLDLMVNATDWVMHNTKLLSIRGRDKSFRPITPPGATARTALKWLNLLLPVALVLFYGLMRSQWRRHQRKQRTRPHHVR
jgi:gliding-associated putative ABC transporter substrate-binding component GldG